MKKLPLYLLTFLILLAIMTGGYLAVPYFFDYSTPAVLKSYELVKDEERVRRHLLEYRGEAPGQETRFSFLEWGRNHPEDFIDILEGMELSERDRFCGLLGFAATDSGQDSEFEAAFSSYDSECLRIIRREISNNRSYQQR